MTKIQDIPFRERWPLVHKWTRRGVKITIAIEVPLGVLALILYFFAGGMTQTETKTTLVNGIQTTVTTATVNPQMAQIVSSIGWSIYGIFLIGILLFFFVGLPMLNSQDDENEEVETKE